jgi:hypothetical protein
MSLQLVRANSGWDKGVKRHIELFIPGSIYRVASKAGEVGEGVASRAASALRRWVERTSPPSCCI